MTGPDRCPNCGSIPPAGAPGGLCPRCLLGGVLRESAPGETADGVLHTLAFHSGPMPRVLLRDADSTVAPGPIVRPSSAEMPDPADRAGRLQLLGEIARGGMGAVLKGRDNDLGRDLAVKVLLERHGDDPGLVRRFVEEAQIAGQLQHPGVVPVYELGTFADHRPYFAMKLVKGRTLAEVLADRPGPSADHPRLLSIFLDIAQTMAYAHARGVIHRDLKPSNVMVGSFGEVQVMDWGLAKLLPRGGATDDRSAGITPSETVIATARSIEGGDLSTAGSVMGTPSYMAPEQARGEPLDERADVFALGSILAEVLTGRPAFAGRTPGEIRRKAARADTAEAVRLIDACGSDPELLALARDCLAVEPDDRPDDAGIVRDRLSAHLAGVQARVQAAERDRAVAQAQAIEERRRRKLQAGLAAAILALAAVGGLAASSVVQQRQAMAAAVDRALGETTTLLAQAREDPEDPARWGLALAAARRVEATPGLRPEAATRLARARSEAESGLRDAERIATLRQTLVEVRSNQQEAGADGTDAAYAAAFRAAGLDLDVLSIPEAANRLRQRTPAVVVELATYLDHWSSQRREADRSTQAWKRLLDVARAADHDPYRNQIRAMLTEGDPKTRATALKALADNPRSGELPPPTSVILADALAGPTEAVALLRKVVAHHPGDIWVNFTLAGVLNQLRPAAREEAVRYYGAARALRPETSHVLAHLLEDMGRGDEAEATYRDLVARRPEVRNLACLGNCLKERGKSVDARVVLDRTIQASREAIRLQPDDANAHRNFGLALVGQGEADAAIAAYREAIRLEPHDAAAHMNLGNALDGKGEAAAAVAAYHEAIRLKPDYARAHYNLGVALARQGEADAAIAAYREAIRLEPHDAAAHNNLGVALAGQGDPDAAVASYREAIRLKPDTATAHSNLGNVLAGKGEADAAIAAYREAIRLRPDEVGTLIELFEVLRQRGEVDPAIAAIREVIRLQPLNASAWNGLGYALSGKLDHAAAIAAYREAIRLKPDYGEAQYNLGFTLLGEGESALALGPLREAVRHRPDHGESHFYLGDALVKAGEIDAAISTYRAAIHLQPELAEAHCNLGQMLRKLGHYEEALAALRRGHELGSRRPAWKNPSADWIREAEREVALAARLDGVLVGSDRPGDAAEWVAFARICKARARDAAACRLLGKAFTADPKLAEDLGAGRRYNAACFAALAGTGRSKDDPAPDDREKARLRDQARDWLKADFTLRARAIEHGPPEAQADARRALTHWKADPDLAGVRDAAELARLPEAEREAWRALWAEVDALLAGAEGPRP